jgi:hypothetical protein
MYMMSRKKVDIYLIGVISLNKNVRHEDMENVQPEDMFCDL